MSIVNKSSPQGGRRTTSDGVKSAPRQRWRPQPLVTRKKELEPVARVTERGASLYSMTFLPPAITGSMYYCMWTRGFVRLCRTPPPRYYSAARCHGLIISTHYVRPACRQEFLSARQSRLCNPKSAALRAGNFNHSAFCIHISALFRTVLTGNKKRRAVILVPRL